MTIIKTERLNLRTWLPQDEDAYWKINQDPTVIEFLTGPLTHEQVHDFVATQNANMQLHGFCLWAAELRETRELIGFIGIQNVPFDAHFTPAVEIGWRLGSQFWGKGLATEGAMAALNYGFTNCDIEKIVAFTVPDNIRSMRVMEKIGMKRDMMGDFLHPKLPSDHRLSKHFLYTVSRQIK